MATDEINFCDPVNNYFKSVLDAEPMDVIIAPTQQYADMVRTVTKPVIIYSWVLNNITEDYFKRDDNIVYTIFSQDDNVLRRITKIMTKHFKDYNEAAARVNKYVDNSPVSQFKNYDYDYIAFYNASGIEPASSEGGRASITITLRVGYKEF